MNQAIALQLDSKRWLIIREVESGDIAIPGGTNELFMATIGFGKTPSEWPKKGRAWRPYPYVLKFGALLAMECSDFDLLLNLLHEFRTLVFVSVRDLFNLQTIAKTRTTS